MMPPSVPSQATVTPSLEDQNIDNGVRYSLESGCVTYRLVTDLTLQDGKSDTKTRTKCLRKMTQYAHKRTATTIIVIILLLCFASYSRALILDQCNSPLGMESGDIRNDQISASSSYEVSVTGPASARLNVDHLGGAWCPRGMVGEVEAKHYLEINLLKVHVISAVATQGRFGNGRGVEYVENYLLEYWRPGLKEWKTYKLYNGSKILKGNTNTYTPVTRSLMPPVHVSKVRFVPHATHPRTVCMRVELFGCPDNDGVVAYSTPQGEERGQDLDLSDSSYDGVAKGTTLTGGLGQLTDGVIGDHNFRANMTRGKGYEWVGWKNESSQPIEFVFQFDRLRNFSAMYIYANNMFSKDVQVFSRARVFFGLEEVIYNARPVEYYYMRDDVSEYARNVSIALKGRMGRFLKLQLYFALKWIMISEIFFLSSPLEDKSNFTDLSSDVENLFAVGPNENHAAGNREIYTDLTGFLHNDFRVPDLRRNQDTSDGAERRQQLIAVIIGILVAVILLLTGAIVFFFWNSKRHKMSCLSQGLFHGPFGQKNEIVRLKVESETDRAQEVSKNGLYAVPFQVTYRGSSYSTTTSQRINPSFLVPSPDYAGYTSADYAVPQATEGSRYNSYRSTPNAKAINAPYFTSFLGKASQILPRQSVTGTLPPNTSERHNEIHSSLREDMYIPTEIINRINNKEVLSEEYEVSSTEPHEPPKGRFPPEVPRHRISVLQKLGEGDFGEVHLGEMEDEEKHKQLVAIKSLRVASSFEVRCGFAREVEILSRLQDPNVVRVVGVSTVEDPLCMLVEYCENGDVFQFLQGRVSSTASPGTTHAKAISYGRLIYIATQIASGMKYLESLNFVHRDLAARNCLIGCDYTIKISDFGVSRPVYRKDYYLTDTNILLPVRWMAWESILLGKYTTKSDVWAFAITLWEVLTLARERPFEDLTDEQVLENARYFFKEGPRKETLSQPANCPKEIYDLMKECWKKNDLDRPSFKEIHMFLQRKNLGYAPSP